MPPVFQFANARKVIVESELHRWLCVLEECLEYGFKGKTFNTDDQLNFLEWCELVVKQRPESCLVRYSSY